MLHPDPFLPPPLFLLLQPPPPPPPPPCLPAVATGGERSLAEVGLQQSAIASLLQAIPPPLLQVAAGDVPCTFFRRVLESKLADYDAGSIRKGAATLSAWLAFCERHSLPSYGAPFSDQMCQWFLHEEDEKAAERAAANPSSKRTGGTVKHSRACALRWLASAVGIPFQAHLPSVRAASKPDRSREPGMSEMWEASLLRHLLRLAVGYEGQRASLVRPYAASAYLMCAASLRQVDALRSPPPVLDEGEGITCFHSVSSLTKGRKRATMRPMPWWVPTTSCCPLLSDTSVTTGLQSALSLLPRDATSMFPGLVGPNGRPASLAQAVGWSGAMAGDTALASSLAWLMTLPPLGIPFAEAKVNGEKKHSPRHTVPEIARVMGMPAPARDELGRWKAQGGRLQRMSNRYSRAAERVLQCLLRRSVLRRVAEVFSGSDGFPRLALSSFALSQHEMTAFAAATRSLLQKFE